jgi:hypothetical protein
MRTYYTVKPATHNNVTITRSPKLSMFYNPDFKFFCTLHAISFTTVILAISGAGVSAMELKLFEKRYDSVAIKCPRGMLVVEKRNEKWETRIERDWW